MSSEPERRTRVLGTFAQLDVWHRAIGTTFEPAVGSELRADDAEWPHNPVSQLAHQGLVASVEHLQAIRAHLDPERAKQLDLFALAHSTLCRTALLGAAQAVWLLTPEQSVRLRRHRNLLTYIQDNHRKGLTTLQKLAGDEPHEGTDQVAAHLDLRIAELSAKRAALGETQAFSSTSMIKEAVHEAFGHRPDAAGLEGSALYAWQSGSGAAHGFIWQTLGRAGTEQSAGVESNGLTPFTARGSFLTLSEPYLAAYHLCEQGWRLLRKRGR
ncbi:hypothetical protein [Nocardia gipuzkoensis]